MHIATHASARLVTRRARRRRIHRARHRRSSDRRPTSLTAPGADEWYLRAPDTVSLYVREFGTGEVVIVLHGGWGMDHGYMLPALRGLETVAHFVIYDQRGSMRSPAPAEKISVQKHVQDLDLLRQRLGVERVTILAHSMGTFLAESYLQAHPDHVKGLILAGAIAPVKDSAHSPLGTSSRTGDSLSKRAEVDAELRKQGLLGKTDLTDQERTRAWRIRFAGVNVYHVDRWREMEGGQVFYNHRRQRRVAHHAGAVELCRAAARASVRALRHHRRAGLRGLRHGAVAAGRHADSESQIARPSRGWPRLVDRPARAIPAHRCRRDSRGGGLSAVICRSASEQQILRFAQDDKNRRH